MMRSAAGLLVATLIGTGGAQAQDAARGETLFRQCAPCHRVGPNARNAVGPVLNGIVGRPSGTVAGYVYSPLNKAAGDAGLVWSEERLAGYLADPNAFLRSFLERSGKPELATGYTRMSFKVADEQQRRDLAAYLAKLAP